MIPRTLTATILLTLQAAAFGADLDSRIDAVTVYPQGATVTRVARASLAAGSNEIRLVGLVGGLDTERLRVEVAGTGVRIGQVNLSTEQQREAFDAEVAAVQADIDDVQLKMRAIDDNSAGAQRRLKFLDSLADGYARQAWTEGASGNADVDSWGAALDLLQSGSDRASELIRNNDKAKAELGKDLSVLQRRLADLRGGSLRSTAIDLELTADRALTTDIRFHYYLPAASWRPRYEARLDSDTGSLQLTQQADVLQQTDEDWSDVRLTLATSEPGGELEAPRLDSEFLDIFDPKAMQRDSAPTVRMQAASPVEEIVVTGSRLPNADIGNFAVSYDIPGRATILNDADEAATLDLAQFAFKTDLVTQVVPRSSTEAFLAARFTYDQELPMYGGDMAVFVDGVFAGNTHLASALPGAEVTLPMGQDRRVEVKTESQGGEGGTSGLISRDKTEVTDYLFEITNRRGVATRVEVLDRIPVSRNRDVEVNVPRTATEPDRRDVDDKPGLFLWTRTLGAGETWRIRHQYSVRYPADKLLRRQ